MLIKSSFPNSVSTDLSFATERGQLNIDSLCDWSNYVEAWQKSPKLEYPLDCFKETMSTGEEEINLSNTVLVELSRTCSDLSAVNSIYVGSSPKRGGYVYKRRKLQRNTIALLSEGNAAEITKGTAGYHSTIGSVHQPFTVPKEESDRAHAAFVVSNDTLDNENPSNFGWQHLQKPSTVLNSQMNDIGNLKSVPNILPINRCSIREDEVLVESSVNNLHKYASKHYSGTDDSCSSSKSNNEHGSTFMKTELKEIGECSSDVVVTEPLEEFKSVKDLCITVLKRHGLLGGVWTIGACASLEVLRVADASCSQSCKICSHLGNPMQMLICDLCEEAFHLSCFNPRVKRLPVDEWYCQPCFRKKPKHALKKSTKKSFNVGEMYKRRKSLSCGDLGPISFMLRDNQSYTSGVRIGKDFQTEVPEWSGPVYDDFDYFGEPVELDPAECASLKGWDCNQLSKSISIGNWIQCREMIYKDTDDKSEGTVCGKWRRAPLSVVQTDDWDCSCALLWDPIHADCAVPQALETDIVLKHLKYVEMLRPRLAKNKQGTNRTTCFLQRKE